MPGIVASGAKAPETNMNGIMIIIPANWTTSGRRTRSPMRPNRALIDAASATSTTTAATASSTVPWNRKPSSDGGGDEEGAADQREQRLVDRAGGAGQTARHRQGGEAVVEAVGVVDGGGDAGVGAGHHRGRRPAWPG